MATDHLNAAVEAAERERDDLKAKLARVEALHADDGTATGGTPATKKEK